MLGVVVAEPESPGRFPGVDEVESWLPDVTPVTTLSTEESSTADSRDLHPHFVRMAYVNVTAVLMDEFVGRTSSEFRQPEPTFMPMKECYPLTLAARDFESGLGFLDSQLREPTVPIPVHADHPKDWGATLDVGVPASLMVAFYVPDVTLWRDLAQVLKPFPETLNLALEVVLPLGVSPVLGECMEVGHIPVQDDLSGLFEPDELLDLPIPLAGLEGDVGVGED